MRNIGYRWNNGQTSVDLTAQTESRQRKAVCLKAGALRPLFLTKTCEFIGFGAVDVTKPYEFIGFGTMDVTKPNLGNGKPLEGTSHVPEHTPVPCQAARATR